MPESGDPAVRIHQWVKAFDGNGVFSPICADDFAAAMKGIADKIDQHLKNSCVASDIVLVDPKDPAKGRSVDGDRYWNTRRLSIWYTCGNVVPDGSPPFCPPMARFTIM